MPSLLWSGGGPARGTHPAQVLSPQPSPRSQRLPLTVCWPPPALCHSPRAAVGRCAWSPPWGVGQGFSYGPARSGPLPGL